MSKKLKSSILCILTTLLAFILAIFIGSNATTSNVAMASEVIVPTTYTTAAKTDFYFIEGAQINVDATGIRFVVKVTKGYYDTLTNNGENQVEFYGVVNGAKADASKAQIKKFSAPTFAENAEDTDTFSMNITIKYDSYVGNNELAYMTELVADAYAKKAYSGKNWDMASWIIVTEHLL